MLRERQTNYQKWIFRSNRKNPHNKPRKNTISNENVALCSLDCDHGQNLMKNVFFFYGKFLL